MSKKVIKITKEGVRESISGNSQELPSSVVFKFDQAAVIESVLSVAEGATGSIGGHTRVVAAPGSLVILPESPEFGQSIDITVLGTDPAGVSGSHEINEFNGGVYAVNVSASLGAGGLTRNFLYFDPVWTSFDGGIAGTSGTFTF